jgi:hypothetical protein
MTTQLKIKRNYAGICNKIARSKAYSEPFLDNNKEKAGGVK